MLLSVIVPLYNEEKSVELCAHDITRYLRHRPFRGELILVDDGSTDRTAELIRSLKKQSHSIRIFHHEINRGKGAAIKTGVNVARGKLIGYLDADLSTAPEAFDDALPLLADHDLVFASRSHPDSIITKRQSGFRELSGKLFNRYVRRELSLPYLDTQCGFKVFRNNLRPLIEKSVADGWAFDAEILARARQSGFTMAEMPVRWNHHAESRVKVTDAPAIYRELKRIRKHINLPPS